MVTDSPDSSPEEPDRGREPQRPDRGDGAGFFTVYKHGQGYWTRMFTGVGAGVLLAFTVQFMYSRLPAYIPPLAAHRGALIGGIIVFIIAVAMLVWRVMNAPTNADFLIATDSEMKKVNWTSRQELIGSTKVVILFMFMIAALLFVLDLYFTRVFYLMGVLMTDAPLWQWVEHTFGLAAKSALDVVTSVIVIGGTIWAVLSASRSR